MLRRKAYDRLLQWKTDGARKALCIFGARQIGKTTIVREFAKDHYENFVEINFIKQPKAKDIFSESQEPDAIIANLTAFTRKTLVPGKTLILFDEIQAYPDVRTAIKFLVEDGRFDYIESGSLLGVQLNDIVSVPVGFEETYRMYPMDLEEFLWANGVKESTLVHLKNCYDTLTPVSQSIHDTMNKLFYSYIVIGGMPEAVQIYVDTHDVARVIRFQNEILKQYRLDVAQYAQKSLKMKIKAIYDALPSQLNNSNRRFYVSAVEPNARIDRYENSFKWLSDAGVALPCYNVSVPQAPLKLNERHSLFKLFMNDVGLLCAACMENIQFDLLNGNLDINLGSILENVMAQSLKSNGFQLRYFDANKYGEIDFVVQNGLRTRLVEIKSGNDYKKHKALDNVRNVSEWSFESATVFCKGNIEVENGVTYMPWYMIMFFLPEQPPKEFKHEIDLSALQ